MDGYIFIQEECYLFVSSPTRNSNLLLKSKLEQAEVETNESFGILDVIVVSSERYATGYLLLLHVGQPGCIYGHVHTYYK